MVLLLFLYILILGTPGYLAPELYEARDNAATYTKQVDMWSCGVLLYVMLSGNVPFDDPPKETKTVMPLEYATVDFMSLPWPAVSAEAKDLIRRLFILDPAERISSETVLLHPWLSRGYENLFTPLPSEDVIRRKRAASPKTKKRDVPDVTPSKKKK